MNTSREPTGRPPRQAQVRQRHPAREAHRRRPDELPRSGVADPAPIRRTLAEPNIWLLSAITRLHDLDLAGFLDESTIRQAVRPLWTLAGSRPGDRTEEMSAITASAIHSVLEPASQERQEDLAARGAIRT